MLNFTFLNLDLWVAKIFLILDFQGNLNILVGK